LAGIAPVATIRFWSFYVELCTNRGFVQGLIDDFHQQPLLRVNGISLSCLDIEERSIEMANVIVEEVRFIGIGRSMVR
jgi:hypothetical protein